MLVEQEGSERRGGGDGGVSEGVTGLQPGFSSAPTTAMMELLPPVIFSFLFWMNLKFSQVLVFFFSVLVQQCPRSDPTRWQSPQPQLSPRVRQGSRSAGECHRLFPTWPWALQ